MTEDPDLDRIYEIKKLLLDERMPVTFAAAWIADLERVVGDLVAELDGKHDLTLPHAPELMPTRNRPWTNGGSSGSGES